MTTRRWGAYVLPGDPTWLDRTLPRYYDLLDDLVVPLPQDGRGWTGTQLPIEECLAIVRAVDSRGLLRTVSGTWTNPDDPLAADTAQRQAAIDALTGVDWIIQLDNDELLPARQVLVDAASRAEAQGIPAVELPMRVIFRRTRRHSFEVAGRDGQRHYEYPGPVAVRPGVHLIDARRTDGPFLRLTVGGDATSLQLVHALERGESRAAVLAPEEAVIHNSWGRTPAAIRAKTRSWGHARDARQGRYFWLVWWPAPITWWALRNFHPFSRGLWPRLLRLPCDD